MALEQIKNFLPVTPLVATSGQPSEAQLVEIAEGGFSMLINLGLLDPKYCLPDEAGAVVRAGMAYRHIPVVFGEPRFSDFERFVAVMDEATRPTFVHCAMNWRVSAFIALYGELRWSWSRETADAHVRKLWQPDAVWSRFIAECRAKLDLD